MPPSIVSPSLRVMEDWSGIRIPMKLRHYLKWNKLWCDLPNYALWAFPERVQWRCPVTQSCRHRLDSLVLTDIESTVEKRSFSFVSPIFSALSRYFFKCLSTLDGSMNSVVGKVGQKGWSLVSMKSAVSCPSRRVSDSPSGPDSRWIGVGREESSAWTTDIPTTFINVKSMVCWPLILRSQDAICRRKGLYPFFSSLRLGWSLSTKIFLVDRRKMAIETTAFSMIGTGRATNGRWSMIGWIFSGKNTCPGGTANLTTGIATGEFHAAYCNLVDIGRFVKSGAFIAQIFCYPRSSTRMKRTFGLFDSAKP